MPASFSPAVTRLRAAGDPGAWDAPWLDYQAEYGLTRDDIPALIDLALNTTVYPERDPAPWAPLHAWRALGQLGAPEAAEPLTGLLARVAEPDQDDDWALTDMLARLDTDPELAAFTISALIRAGAVEAAPAIEAAFAADRVEWSINGDWEDVQLALGLITERRTPRPRYLPPALDALSAFDSERAVDPVPPDPDVGTAAQRARARDKTKSKRKAAARSRQANRRKR